MYSNDSMLGNISTKSTSFSYYDSFSIVDSSQLSSPTLNRNSLLNRYRITKPNQTFIVKNIETKAFLPQIFCTLLGIDNLHSSNRITQCSCHCNRNEDGYCELIMKWVEQQYFWKTDRQFYKIYAHYSSKRLDEVEEAELSSKLQQKIDILGLELPIQNFKTVLQILSNYQKHALYYNKYNKLIANSDIYIWVVLGICYHIGFDGSIHEQKKAIIFWALDIIMDCFEDLTPAAINIHYAKCMKRFQHYYSKWMTLLSSKGVNLGNIVREWLNQMMFGYMGIQSIGFFLNCFKKSGWNFVFKVMLSYFEYRSSQIKKNQRFLAGTIQSEELHKLILDGQEEWPMVFCSASSFAFQE